MIEQELQGFAQRASARNHLLHRPQDESEDDGVACVAGESEEREQHHRPGRISEADHAVGGESESEVADHRLDRVNRPPDIVLTAAGKNFAILGRAVEDPWHESNDTEDVKARIQRDDHLQQQFEGAVLDTSKLFTVLWRQSAEVGVPSDGDLGRESR